MATRTLHATESATARAPVFERLDTYFLFPFALDKAAIQSDHPQAWPGKTKWIDGLDSWIAGESGRRESHGMKQLGPWKRASYTSFDLDSPVYSDLLFFNSIVRHVFFDTTIGRGADDQENQLRCYTVEISRPARLWFEGSDALGRRASIEVVELRLYLSAQGIGVLSIGVASGAIDAAEGLWINRRLRKLYPVDSSSIREGRTPNYLALRLEEAAQTVTVAEERFERPAMVGFYPPLPNTVKGLLYFADYALEEYEPVLDENMLVYSYGELAASTPAEAGPSPLNEIIDDFLFLRHKHTEAVRQTSSHSTFLFGYTGHSCSVLRLKPLATSSLERTDSSREDSPVQAQNDDLDTLKTFHTRYYLMMVIALFYRAILLDFSERSALVSRRLLRDQQNRKLTAAGINMVNDLRTEFLNFCSYWHFDDLSCKREYNDLFRRLCAEYKIDEMKEVLSSELRHMGDFVYNFYQLRNTDAVNRLAMLSLIFGGGAVLTGFFGMNFGREFGKTVFEGQGYSPLLHYLLITFVTGFVLASVALGAFVLLRNWRDYFYILSPPKDSTATSSIKRDG